MKCTLAQFFTLFIGDGAKYSVGDNHTELGDFDVKATEWGKPLDEVFPKDDFDYPGDAAPERLLTFSSYTR
jgi:hypothetical protein